MIACDSGSSDCGPIPLGSDGSASPLAWQRHDIEAMLVGARRLGVPMTIGSAGDTGTNSRVDRYVAIVQELAHQHRIPQLQAGLLLFGGAEGGGEAPRGRRRRRARFGRAARPHGR